MTCEPEHICWMLYFSQITIAEWVNSFTAFSLKYSSEVGRLITHFEFRRQDGGGPKKKPYRFIKRNQKYLEDNDTNTGLQMLSFYSIDKNINCLSPPLGFTIYTKYRTTPFNVAVLHFQSSCLGNTQANANFFKNIITDLSKFLDINYGIVRTLDVRKYPLFYSMGIDASGWLDETERMEAKLWDKQGKNFSKIIWDVNWGNILSKSHWGNDPVIEKRLMEAINYECEGNVHWLNNEAVYFHAPFELDDTHDCEVKLKKFRDRVREIFIENNIHVLALSERG